MKCRFCQTELKQEFIDLVNAPPSNAYLTSEELNLPETFFPLKLYVCHNCFLVQIDEYKKSNEIFNEDYSYFSSYSKSWLNHARDYVNMISERLQLGTDSFVVEVASNDGYLLQFFKEKKIPCLGIDPSRKTVAAALDKGIETLTDYFDPQLAQKISSQRGKADLIVGNNILAHVPNIRDFVSAHKILLNINGVITMEFPHILRLIAENQFDTIYHEHFSYLSFQTVNKIFNRHALKIFDVEELSTHGGSLRIYAKHSKNDFYGVSENVGNLLRKETEAGIDKMSYYQDFRKKADRVKYDLLSFLIEQKKLKRLVAGYGAAAKGNTLLNYAGIKNDLIPFIVDASPHKQKKYMPGSHIPIVTENEIMKWKPDYILILPWNIKDEIMLQLSYTRDWGSRFVVAIPELTIL